MSQHDDTPTPWSPPGSSGWTPVVPLGGVQPGAPALYPPPQGQPVTAVATPRSAGRAARVVAGVIALVGGLLLVAGSFLDWVQADIVGEGIRVGSGWSNVSGEIADGPLIAGLGAIVAIWGAITLAASITGRWVLAGFVAAGAATAVVVFEIVDLTSPTGGVETELQAGVWVMVAGCALALVGAVIAAFAVRAAGGSTSPTAPDPTAARADWSG